MAYVTGTANSLADLLTAIQNACTANGWTLSGNVLHKGACYIEIASVTSLATVYNHTMAVADGLLTVRGGTGVDGSNALSGACDTTPGGFAWMPSVTNAPLGFSTPASLVTFPVLYEVFINATPDEVYVVITYGVNYYQTIGFGQSTMDGIGATGNWYCGASFNSLNGPRYQISSAGENGTYLPVALSLFCRSTCQTFGVHTAIDGSTWACEGAWRDWASVVGRQPNTWNGEAVLVPIRVYKSRASGFVTPVLECAHARYMAISNLSDGQIITIGSDKWKVYPWYHRNAAMGVNPSNLNTDSAQFGHVFRYDGP